MTKMEITGTHEIEASKTEVRIKQQIGSITLEARRMPELASDEGEHTTLSLTLPMPELIAIADQNAEGNVRLHLHAEGPHARIALANTLRAAVNILELE
jgi:hypothetical protein